MDQQNNQVKYCSYCGSQNNKENKFCTSCGGNLEEIVQEQTISQDTPVNNNQPILQPKQSPKEEKKLKFGFQTLAGIIILLNWSIFIPLVLIISVVIIILYLTLPNTRKNILSLVNILGYLAIGGFALILILFGACFIMIGL
jgi:uncharacterized membrane protein YvbJ